MADFNSYVKCIRKLYMASGHTYEEMVEHFNDHNVFSDIIKGYENGVSVSDFNFNL